jgi:hypothetical protein
MYERVYRNLTEDKNGVITRDVVINYLTIYYSALFSYRAESCLTMLFNHLEANNEKEK